MEGDIVSISIEIDNFTPCLVECESGKIINTHYSLATKEDLKVSGWNFNWNSDDLKDADIYKLTIDNDNKIQGLVAIKDNKKNYAIYLQLAESSPDNIGSNKHFEGVGGHLFAIAVQKSFEKGYGGFVYFEAKNQQLVKHYQETFGAKNIGGVHQFRMIIDEEAGKELLKKYTLEEEK